MKMNLETMYKDALSLLRGDIQYDEIDTLPEYTLNGKRCSFFDEDEHEVVINNVNELQITEFMANINNSAVDIDEVVKAINTLDKRVFFGLNDIYVAWSEEDYSFIEEETCRDLHDEEEALGLACTDTKNIIINIPQIVKYLLDRHPEDESLFTNFVKEFYYTLVHEIGHISVLTKDILGKNYSPIECFDDGEYGMDEEFVVEDFAREMVSLISKKIDIDNSFNRVWFEKNFA